MNVIFLDIDGVLNSSNYFDLSKERKHNFYKVNKYDKNNIEQLAEYMMIDINIKNLEILKSIIDITNSKVVITSSWKNLKVFRNIVNHLIDLGIPIVGQTVDSGLNRGEGILNYIKEYNIDNYIVLDDDIFKDYNAEILSRLVKTSFDEDGLDEKAKVKAISLLNS